MQKEEATFGNLSLASRRARSINHIQGKNLPFKFCATAREVAAARVHREFSIESRGGRGRDGKRGRPYWVLCIVFQRVSTSSTFRPLRFSSFYPRLLPSHSSIVYLFRCLFVSFGMKNIVYAAVGV